MGVEHCVKLKIKDYDHYPEHSGIYDIMLDRYWIVTKDDEVLLYRGYSFQCNKNFSIVEKMIELYPECIIKNIPVMVFPYELTSVGNYND